MRDIYLDNSATTPLANEVKIKMVEAMECYGNPSSLHSKGFESSKMIADARNKILSSLFVRNGKPENLIFTAGGSEADNLALGAIMMTYECGIRFLADHLNGDTYFRIKREGHNLDRARTQFKLVNDMESKLDNMKEIIKTISQKH